jgi:diguanylate cyclase (GGDEF)-like protein
LLVLAQCDRFLGRFRRVHDTARQAARIFRLVDDVQGEVEALALLSQACSYLGRDEEAVEVGLLAVELGDMLPQGAHQVLARNYLGMAYFWSSAFAQAQEVLNQAHQQAAALVPCRSARLPLLNQVWAEAIRLVRDRYFNGKTPECELLRSKLSAYDELGTSGSAHQDLIPGEAQLLEVFAKATRALVSCWCGELDAALAGLPALPGGPGRPQAAAVVCTWVRAEISWASGDLQAAAHYAQQLVDQATRAEFEQMAIIGHLVLSQLYEQAGQHDASVQELRALRRREQRVRSERVESIHRVVESKLEVRKARDNLEQLVRYSRELERLSFEDWLTGLPNRRRFDQTLQDLLSAGIDPQTPGCVALIDLDKFKHINDTHTHAGGDDVLKGVAQVLRQEVRDTDMAARLAGDEFVVLFPRATLVEARAVCDRIEAAVTVQPWELVAPDLKVSVTIGLAEAQPCDTPSMLLHRSDVDMFEHKRRKAAQVAQSS